jgi:dipeptidyl aminopeptidase B
MAQFSYDRVDDADDEEREDSGSQPRIVRPATYYGDGPFDAPSSESEDDLLLEKPPSPGLAESGVPRSLQRRGGHRRPASLRCLILCLLGLVGLAAAIGALAAASYKGGQAYRPRGTKRIEMDHVMNGTFYSQRRSLNWVAEGIPPIHPSSMSPAHAT